MTDPNCNEYVQPEDPQDCKAGYYSIAHDMTCTPCPKGHYCSGTKATTP